MNFLKSLIPRGVARSCVGSDKFGNKYFESVSQLDAKKTLREVQTVSGDVLEPVRSPPLWESWLRHTRATPPSDAELDEFDSKAKQLQLNIQEIERKDRKLRLQEQLERETQNNSNSDDAIVAFQWGAKKNK
jgi:NADH:ubiquinone oxidoreductase subunit